MNPYGPFFGVQLAAASGLWAAPIVAYQVGRAARYGVVTAALVPPWWLP